MAEKTVVISQQYLKPIQILKWKIREGFSVSVGSVVLLYDFEKVDKKQQRKFKSPQAGTVCKLIAQEGAIIRPGEALFEVEACIHPTVMNDMCADCGADLRKDDLNAIASVPMIHSVPELKVSQEIAQRIGKADSDRLLKDKKLVLLVDLDQTLIHTTNDIIPPNIKDVYHFQLYGPNSPWYHTRLRPGTHQFLTNISIYFELHICTFGARNYAHRITAILDADQRFFSNRVLSRDECFNPTSKTANLKALFPCGDHMVCIIDDREDVWSYASNLIHVKPYHFFKHTGDINAPPGLEKHENDEKEGVDLTNFKSKDEKIADNEDNQTPPLKNIDATNCKSKAMSEKIDEKIVDEKDNQTPPLKNVAATNRKIKATSENKIDEKIVDEKDNQTPPLKNIAATNCKSKATSENMVDEKIVDEKDKQTLPLKNDHKIDNVDEETILKKNDDELDVQVVNNNKKNIPTADNIIEEKAANTNLNGKTETDAVEGSNGKVENVKTNNNELEEKTTTQDNHIKDNSKEDAKEQTKESCEESQENKSTLNSSLNLTEIEDSDDYLLYLEDILKRIHQAFYDEYDRMESGEVPDLKKVIPAVKGRVLKGCKMIFSGLVPTHIKLEHSRAYQVAHSLGAEVTQEFEDSSTHLVAVRPGTAKVNAGRRRKDLKIVTPDWLWACAERWEHVDEKIFPLNSKGSKNRHPPPHCSSPEHVPNYAIHNTPASRKRTPSGRFMDTINPLMSFSSADIADMDKEVEDILDAESESEDEDITTKMDTIDELAKDKEDSSSSSGESLTAEMPRGHKRRLELQQDEELEDDTKDSDDCVSAKFRRGEQLDSDLDIGQDSNSEGSTEAPDEIDDGEWNMMGAALEREFLSNS